MKCGIEVFWVVTSPLSLFVMVTTYLVMFISEKGGIQVRRMVDCVVCKMTLDGASSNPDKQINIDVSNNMST